MSDGVSLASEKWVRIMADYCATGVWDQGGGLADTDDLPVSSELKKRLRAWQSWYEKNEYWRANCEPFDVNAFSHEGREIARLVKRELPDWTVVYFDEAACENAASDAPREQFEYQIIL